MMFSPAPQSRVPTPSPAHRISSKAFEEYKASLSCTTLLAHLDPSAPLALITDASMSAMGAILQQRVKNASHHLTFSKKLKPVQQKYITYNHELVAIYMAVKHFCHMLEARHFESLPSTSPSLMPSSSTGTNAH
jgi:hypothetical protein